MQAENIVLKKWRIFIEKWQASGLSQRAFCQNIGVGYSTFLKWKSRINQTLIQINETILDQTSNITYDALGHMVQIIESQSGTTTSTKQFIWCGNTMCEARDANNNLSTQYFNYGLISYSGGTGTNYYFTRDSLSSIREVTDATGQLISQYNYTVFGQAQASSGVNGQAPGINSDFQYAGYYYHAPSGLNLTTYRAYNPNLARFLTRDPIGEAGGINLYAYVMNDPVAGRDPLGLDIWCSSFANTEFNHFVNQNNLNVINGTGIVQYVAP